MHDTTYGVVAESMIERDFWHHVANKTRRLMDDAQSQVVIGKYRVDALFKINGRQVVVELDGKEFHQDVLADRRREDVLLETVDEIIRIPGAAMYYFGNATFQVLGGWHPRFKIAKEVTTMTLVEYKAEKQRFIDNPEELHDYGNSIARWIEDVDSSFQIIDAGDEYAKVGSPKAFEECWSLRPITRRRKGKRLTHRSPAPPGANE